MLDHKFSFLTIIIGIGNIFLLSIFFYCWCICVNEVVVPKIAMLKELEEGLQQYGFLSQIRDHPAIFQPIFTASSCFDITADDFLQRLVVHFSQQQFLKSKEKDIFKYFTDFIQALYYEGKFLLIGLPPTRSGFDCKGCKHQWQKSLDFIHIGICEVPELRLKDVLKFITGWQTIPPNGFPCDLNVHFKHGCQDRCQCRPTASTCALVLILPIHSCSSRELGDLLISALSECCGFGNV